MAFLRRNNVSSLKKPSDMSSISLKCMKILLTIAWIFCHFCVWISGYAAFSSIKGELLNSTHCGMDMIMVLLMYELMFKWKRIVEHVRALPTVRPTEGKICNAIRIFNCVNIALIVVPFFLTGIEIYAPERYEHLDGFWAVKAFTLNSNVTLSPAIERLCMWAEKCIFCFGQIVPLYVVPTSIGCLSIYLAYLFEITNKEVHEQLSSAGLKCADITAIRKKYMYLQNLVVQLDRALSRASLLWFLTSLVATCSGITELLKYQATLQIADLLDILFYYGIPFLHSGFLSFCASRIPRAVQEGFLLVRDIPLADECRNHYAYNEQSLLMSYLSSPPTGMTLGGLFQISISTFVSHIGCIITYMVIILQLFPDLMRKLRGGI